MSVFVIHNGLQISLSFKSITAVQLKNLSWDLKRYAYSIKLHNQQLLDSGVDKEGEFWRKRRQEWDEKSSDVCRARV